MHRAERLGRQTAPRPQLIVRFDVRKRRYLFLKFKREFQLYRSILADPRTPKLAKILLGLAVAYAITPVDFIPDFIPVLGHLDDAIIVPVLVYLALKTIPPSLLKEHRQAQARYGSAHHI